MYAQERPQTRAKLSLHRQHRTKTPASPMSYVAPRALFSSSHSVCSAPIHVKAVALTAARFASVRARIAREFLCSTCLLCLFCALLVVSVIRNVPCLTFLVMPHHRGLVICHGNAVGETTVLFLMHPRCWSLKNFLHLELLRRARGIDSTPRHRP